MGDLRGYLGLAQDAWAGFQAAPLSVRKALLCAVLLDDLAGRAFAAWRDTPDRSFGAEDVLLFRRELRAQCPALGLLADLCGMRPEAPRLIARAVEVPAAAYPALAIEDYMVSLYNAGTVQRVVLTWSGGERLAHEVLAEALEWWRARIGAGRAEAPDGQAASGVAAVVPR